MPEATVIYMLSNAAQSSKVKKEQEESIVLLILWRSKS